MDILHDYTLSNTSLYKYNMCYINNLKSVQHIYISPVGVGEMVRGRSVGRSAIHDMCVPQSANWLIEDGCIWKCYLFMNETILHIIQTVARVAHVPKMADLESVVLFQTDSDWLVLLAHDNTHSEQRTIRCVYVCVCCVCVCVCAWVCELK